MPSTLEAREVTGAKTGGLIKWFADTGIEDVPLVGGKNASLGEMVRELGPKGVKMPNGFSIKSSTASRSIPTRC